MPVPAARAQTVAQSPVEAEPFLPTLCASQKLPKQHCVFFLEGKAFMLFWETALAFPKTMPLLATAVHSGEHSPEMLWLWVPVIEVDELFRCYLVH